MQKLNLPARQSQPELDRLAGWKEVRLGQRLRLACRTLHCSPPKKAASLLPLTWPRLHNGSVNKEPMSWYLSTYSQKVMSGTNRHCLVMNQLGFCGGKCSATTAKGLKALMKS